MGQLSERKGLEPHLIKKNQSSNIPTTESKTVAKQPSNAEQNHLFSAAVF